MGTMPAAVTNSCCNWAVVSFFQAILAYLTFFAAVIESPKRLYKRKNRTFRCNMDSRGFTIGYCATTICIQISSFRSGSTSLWCVGWTLVAGIAEVWACLVVELVKADVRPFLEVKHLTAWISLGVNSGRIVSMTANAASLVLQFAEIGCRNVLPPAFERVRPNGH